MPDRSTMTTTRTALIGGALVALGPISMALYTPALPTLVRVFGTDVATAKLTLTVYFAGFAFAQLACGPLSDAWGRRPTLTAFLLLYLGGSLVAVFAPTVETLLLARAIQGVGAAAGVATARAIVRDLFTGPQSVGVMNLIGLTLAVGPALSPTIGGLTLDLTGWHAIFVLMAVYGVALLAIVRLVLPETLATPDPGALDPRRIAGAYRTLLADRRFLAPTIVIAATVGSLYALATMLPFVLIDRVGLTPTQYGVGMLAQSGAYLLGALIVRSLLKRLSPNRLVAPGIVLCGVGGAALAVFTWTVPLSFVSVMTPIGLFAMGIAFVMPAMTTAALAPFGRIAGSASALMGFLQIGGGLLGSAAAALLHDPVRALGTVVPIMAAVAVVAFLLLPRGEAAATDRTAGEGATA